MQQQTSTQHIPMMRHHVRDDLPKPRPRFDMDYSKKIDLGGGLTMEGRMIRAINRRPEMIGYKVTQSGTVLESIPEPLHAQINASLEKKGIQLTPNYTIITESQPTYLKTA